MSTSTLFYARHQQIIYRYLCDIYAQSRYHPSIRHLPTSLTCEYKSSCILWATRLSYTHSSIHGFCWFCIVSAYGTTTAAVCTLSSFVLTLSHARRVANTQHVGSLVKIRCVQPTLHKHTLHNLLPTTTTTLCLHIYLQLVLTPHGAHEGGKVIRRPGGGRLFCRSQGLLSRQAFLLTQRPPNNENKHACMHYIHGMICMYVCMVYV